MGRAPCCDKANVKKGPWSPEEDAKLKSYIEQHGTGGNWIALPQKIGLKRCGKSCRLRWLNYLRPNLKHGGFSDEEDHIICSLYISIGSRWSIIAAQLPGRTDNDIKNYWNTRLKKKLLGKHRKESQQARNRGNNNNGGVVKHESNNNRVSNNGEYSLSSLVQEHSYLPHVMLPMPSPPQPLQMSNQSFNEQDSIRKLLIKLGGRLSSDYHHPDPTTTTSTNFDGLNLQFSNNASSSMEQSFQEQQVHVGSSSACVANSVNNNEVQFVESGQYCGLDLVQGEEEDYFTPSIEMVSTTSYPQRFDGLEFFYGDMINNNKIIGSSTTPCGKSVSYGETTTPIYRPLDSNYQG